MLGSLISGVVGLVSNLFTNNKNAQIARENNEFNAQQSLLQHQRNIELWNMNNEYNTPANQIKRLEEAGLSPYLAYSNGAAGGTASAPSAPSAMRAESYQFKNPLSGLTEIMGLLSSVESLKNQKLQNEKQSIDNKWQDQILSNQYWNSFWTGQFLNKRQALYGKYADDEWNWRNMILNNRASASTFDKDLARARLQYYQNTNLLQKSTLNYYNQFGYEGRKDYERMLYQTGIPSLVGLGGKALGAVGSRLGMPFLQKLEGSIWKLLFH